MRQWLLVLLPAVLVLGLGIGVGALIGRSTKSSEKASYSALPVSAVGDARLGGLVWAAKRCSDCHSFAGKGGKDGPPLDFMQGKLSAKDVANMSGSVWNHMPTMVEHFREEKIALPTFSGDEMANLLAYLHTGASSPPP